jgi:iron-sulfur cluster assembly accessory protein
MDSKAETLLGGVEQMSEMHRQEQAQTEPVAPVTLTPVAVEQTKLALQRRGLNGGVLRVGVTGGGCSGFQYSLSVEPQSKPGDVVVEQDGVRIAVDAEALPYLKGTLIDYVQGLHSAGFKFVNPNAARTCGCGSSFSVEATQENH